MTLSHTRRFTPVYGLLFDVLKYRRCRCLQVQETTGSGWTPNMGGALELFECDAQGCPERVTLRAYPANNTLAFFTVGPTSFHQVGEVLSLELPRLSINGWFHGPAPQPAPHEAAPPVSLQPHSQVVRDSCHRCNTFITCFYIFSHFPESTLKCTQVVGDVCSSNACSINAYYFL